MNFQSTELERRLSEKQRVVRAAAGVEKAAAFAMGVSGQIDPFMTLSFMSLTVIPEIRLTTRGAFDVAAQQYL